MSTEQARLVTHLVTYRVTPSGWLVFFLEYSFIVFRRKNTEYEFSLRYDYDYRHVPHCSTVQSWWCSLDDVLT
jgi:hypothetical protein